MTQLASLEAKRAAEYARLDGLKADLVKVTEERNVGIQKVVDTAPDRKPTRDGFLGRVTTFGTMLRKSPKLFVIVGAIEAIALGLELAPILAHCIFPSSTFPQAMPQRWRSNIYSARRRWHARVRRCLAGRHRCHQTRTLTAIGMVDLSRLLTNSNATATGHQNHRRTVVHSQLAPDQQHPFCSMEITMPTACESSATTVSGSMTSNLLCSVPLASRHLMRVR